MKKEFKERPKPCPCCNGIEIYVGVLSVSSQGVRCLNPECGLRLAVTDDDLVLHDMTWKTIEDFDGAALKLAIERWNRRP